MMLRVSSQLSCGMVAAGSVDRETCVGWVLWMD